MWGTFVGLDKCQMDKYLDGQMLSMGKCPKCPGGQMPSNPENNLDRHLMYSIIYSLGLKDPTKTQLIVKCTTATFPSPTVVDEK